MPPVSLFSLHYHAKLLNLLIVNSLNSKYNEVYFGLMKVKL